MKLTFLAIISLLVLISQNDDEHPYLINVIGFDCDSTIFSKDSINPRLTKFKQERDGLIEVSVTFGENCGLVSNGTLEVHGDTLNLKYDGKKIFKTSVITTDSIQTEIEYVTSDFTSCDCIFELTYFIQAVPNIEYSIKLDGKLLKTRPNNGEHP
jgi:hypothetical protein